MSIDPLSFTGNHHTARSLAFEVLQECRDGTHFVQNALDRRLKKLALSPLDRRLSLQLAAGVMRRRGSLDALLQTVITREPHRVEPWLWDMARLGTLQIAYLSGIPSHAALNETVELAALFDRARAKGFLNGVLRSIQRLLADETASEPAADALPLEAGNYRRLTQPVLPDPGTHPVEYLAAGFALPAWLAQRWLARFGWEECLRLGFWFLGPAPLWLRCNGLRIGRAAFLDALAKAGVTAEPGNHPQAIRLAEHAAIRELPGYAKGWFTVQDESAMRVASALNPRPGMKVLDLCAAPGGKTTHVAELMRNQGRILACDVNDHRLRKIRQLCERLGIRIVETRLLDAEREEAPPLGPFDAILVDVPCSNTGVFGRRPEARWRLKPDDIRRLVMLQMKLLGIAGERVRPGGAIVYSTCSIETEENQQVVRAVLQERPDLTLEAEEEYLPGKPADGGYWARLRRQNA